MTKPLTKRQETFLDSSRTYGIVRIAAKKAGVSHELHYNAMRVSETYRQAFAAIQQEHALGLEEQAREIAVDGIPEPVYYGRKLVAFKRKHSDQLLIRLLEANDPEKFGRPKAPPRRRRRPDNGAFFRTRLPQILAEKRAQSRSDRSTWKRLRRTGTPAEELSPQTAEARWEELRKLARQHARPKTAPPAEVAEPSNTPRRWCDLRRRLTNGPTGGTAQQCLDGSLNGSASGEGRGKAPTGVRHAECLRRHGGWPKTSANSSSSAHPAKYRHSRSYCRFVTLPPLARANKSAAMSAQ